MKLSEDWSGSHHKAPPDTCGIQAIHRKLMKKTFVLDTTKGLEYANRYHSVLPKDSRAEYQTSKAYILSTKNFGRIEAGHLKIYPTEFFQNRNFFLPKFSNVRIDSLE